MGDREDSTDQPIEGIRESIRKRLNAGLDGVTLFQPFLAPIDPEDAKEDPRGLHGD